MSVCDRPILAYAHMGKVGGKRLLLYLRSHFGFRHLDIVHTWDERTYSAAELQRDLHIQPGLRSIGGHNVRPCVDFSAVARPLVWYTILREPVGRLLSHYVQQRMHAYTESSLSDWLDRYDRANWQVRMLAGEINLAKALDLLHEKFRAVGVNDRYEESLLLIAHRLGLKGLRFNDRRGAAPPEPPPLWADARDQADRIDHRLQEMLRFDTALYETARREFFEKHVLAYGRERLSADLRRLADAPPVARRNWRNLASLAGRKLLHEPLGRLAAPGARRRSARPDES